MTWQCLRYRYVEMVTNIAYFDKGAVDVDKVIMSGPSGEHLQGTINL